MSDCRTNLTAPPFDLLPRRTLPYLCFICQLVSMRGIKFLLAEVNCEREHVSFVKITYYVGKSISELQIQVVTYVLELSVGNCHR